ncbi:MAG: signal peptide peptidase SppA [Candidatus Eisenbacteria bacterium]|uniref:Signal peptide peptidase SppA n=1 Tax=Eiseniibacteriota bacterium TaxID=2212470 RepID=A0A933SCA5_UNCEI|nr:signal peptide peptidase SppA [Candidatus Eisenbacteria bacterium]
MRTFVLALALVASAAPAFAQSPVSSFSLATLDDARAAQFQAAALATRHDAEWRFEWSGLDGRRESLAAQAYAGGFGAFLSDEPGRVRTWGASFGGGSDALRFGWTGYRVSQAGARRNDHRFAALSRPAAWLSLAGVVDHAFEPTPDGVRTPRAWTAAVALRPLALDRAHAHDRGTRLALTADAMLDEGAPREWARVRVGVECEPVDGLAFAVATTGRDAWRVGLTLRGLRGALGASNATQDDATVNERWSLSAHSGEERTRIASRRDRRVALVRAGGVLADEGAGGSVMGDVSTVDAGALRAQLDRALEDPLTRGVLLDLRGVAGMAQLEELRPRIEKLRAAGKPVVASLESGGGRGDLYLASAGTRAFASEEAIFAGLGLRTERRYYREMLERYGLRMDRASVGAFKSAYRNFSVDRTPAADSIVIQHALDVRQELFLRSVAASRGVGRERFAHVLDGRGWTSADLVTAGLLDSVGYREDAWRETGRLSGLGAKPRTVNLRRIERARRTWHERSPIAVVYAGGGIEEGRSGGGLVSGAVLGSETLIAQLERAFRDRETRVVVLRIESPGGSVVASNLIDHAIVRLKRETGKPLVVSMGSVAASGGYYIALRADRIYADRHTATGSIGVLYVKPSLEGAYAKQHVRQEDFERGEYMGGFSIARDWTPAMQAAADSAIGRSYAGFKARVAEGRKLSPEKVEEIAQGRVWFGEDALRNGLVDAIGGLDAALADARERAGVTRGEKIRLREFRRPRGSLLERAFGGWVRGAIQRETRMPDWRGAQARDDAAWEWVAD